MAKLITLETLGIAINKIKELFIERDTAFDGLEERVTANETAISNKLNKAGGTIGSEEKWTVDCWGITGNGNQILSEFSDVSAATVKAETIEGENGSLNISGDVEFGGEVNFSYYGTNITTNTTLTAKPGQIYVYAKSSPISALDITLAKIEVGKGNEYTIKFTPAVDDMPITITDNTADNILWHNEPKVIAGKAYTLCINITGEYKEAVLSYAE